MLFKRPSKYWKKSRENKKIQNRDPFYDKINEPNSNDKSSLEKKNLINESERELIDFSINNMNKNIIDIDTLRIDETILEIKDQKQTIFFQKEIPSSPVKTKEQTWWEKKKGINS